MSRDIYYCDLCAMQHRLPLRIGEKVAGYCCLCGAASAYVGYISEPEANNRGIHVPPIEELALKEYLKNLNNKKKSMNDNYRKFFFALMLIIISAILGLIWAFPIMWCWNFAMIPIFKLPAITWGQAWCLHMLSLWLVKSSLYEVKKS